MTTSNNKTMFNDKHMAQNTPVVIGSNVTGNIGSCEVKTTTLSIDSWHNQTFATNSCSGEVIYTSPVYFDWGVIYYPLVIVFVAVTIFTAITRLDEPRF